MAVLLNSNLMENFLMHISVCGGFMLIMANGIKQDDELSGILDESDEDGNNPQDNRKRISIKH